MSLARKLLAHFEGTPLHLDMKAVLGKIAESLEGEVTLEPEWLGFIPDDTVAGASSPSHKQVIDKDGRSDTFRVLAWRMVIPYVPPYRLEKEKEWDLINCRSTTAKPAQSSNYKS